MVQWRCWVFMVAVMAASGLRADVVEERVDFAGGLGGGVLYHDREQTDRKVGVVVVHEWWGLNDYSRARARQLAALGYPAIAVDMYGHGKVASHAEDAKAFMQAALAQPEQMNARFEGARRALEEKAGVPRGSQYAVGYCFGGAVVLGQARRGADLAGVASFHGSLGTETPAAPGAVTARILVATGGSDVMVPAAQVAGFVQEMSEAGAALELLSFPGVQHGFTNPDATATGKATGLPLAYDAAADRASWAALLRLLRGEAQ